MSFSIATYNVKDLFEATDAAGAAHLDRKLEALAKTIDTLDADVIALQEVGSEAVLDALRARLLHAGTYAFRAVGTADARGIRCALLSRAQVRSWRVHTAERLDFPRFVATDPAPFGARIPLRRGVVHAEIDAGDLGTVHVLVLHFKSGRPLPLRAADGTEMEPATARERAEGALRTLVWRASEALFVRGLIDDLFATRADNVVVAGDYNDVPGSVALRVVAGEGETALFSAADAFSSEVPSPQPWLVERFSVMHRGAKSEIDHVLMSSPLRARVQSTRFFNEGLRDHTQLDPGEPPPADSDHAPLVVRFA